jgi:Ca-activated chloride channel family protein
VSSFGVDVDTASYTFTRAVLDRDELPDPAAISVEEFINYFDYDYAPPPKDDFSLHAEIVPSTQRPGYHILHLGVKARDIPPNRRDPASVVFVIDLSGSMGRQGRLDLVKGALRLLAVQLEPKDRIGLVVFGSGARVVLPLTPGDQTAAIEDAIASMEPEGATNVQAGLGLAYGLLERQGATSGLRRIVLCSDGVANTQANDTERLLAEVTARARKGISISTLGVAMGNYTDVLMEQLAQKGDGNFAYVDRLQEARRMFVHNLTGTLQVVAYDAKLQVEFDADVVSRYRLLGYENRALLREEFESDRSDAGEIGAGHAVTGIYEIQIRDLEARGIGRLRLRYKAAKSGKSRNLERKLPMSLVRGSVAEASPGTALSLVAAAFAEKLRGSFWVRDLSWEALRAMYDQLSPEQRSEPMVAELGTLIDRASRLHQRGERPAAEGSVSRLDFDRVPVVK